MEGNNDEHTNKVEEIIQTYKLKELHNYTFHVSCFFLLASAFVIQSYELFLLEFFISTMFCLAGFLPSKLYVYDCCMFFYALIATVFFDSMLAKLDDKNNGSEGSYGYVERFTLSYAIIVFITFSLFGLIVIMSKKLRDELEKHSINTRIGLLLFHKIFFFINGYLYLKA